jgi:hypothetical protein
MVIYNYPLHMIQEIILEYKESSKIKISKEHQDKKSLIYVGYVKDGLNKIWLGKVKGEVKGEVKTRLSCIVIGMALLLLS